MPAGTAVGRLPGDFNVTSRGAASYSIPISVPAGRNGLRPSVALSYNSQRGAGIAGVGWGLAGLSAIRRCNQIIDLDGAVRGVQYDASDRFCLDGSTLLLVTGTYGGNNATYRPEVHDYQLVTSLGTTGTGPSEFTVQLRNGLVYRYGNDTDSRIMAGTEIDTWALNEIEDTLGNKIEFVYTRPAGDLEYVVSEILWTSGNGNTPQYRLLFEYTTRIVNGIDQADVRRGYLAGVAWQRTQRLDKIRYQYAPAGTYNDVHVYTLNYSSQADTGAASGQSQLISVTQCEYLTTGQDCLPATEITYAAPGNDGWNAAPTRSWPQVANFDGVAYGDFDGDGRTDIFWPDSAGKWAIIPIDENGDILPPRQTGTSHGGNAGYPLEYNGDGRTDLLTVVGTTWQVLQASGSQSAPSFIVRDTGIPSAAFSLANIIDLNGDGLGDLTYICNTNQICYYINNGSQSGSAFTVLKNVTIPGNLCGQPEYVLQVHDGTLRSADFNGDGLQDLMVFASCNNGFDFEWEVMLSEGETISSQLYGTPTITKWAATTDINGDGLSDLVGTDWNNDWAFAISTGTGFLSQQSTGIDARALDVPRIADANDDGLLDMIVQSADGAQWRLYLSDGETYSSAAYTVLAAPPPTSGARLVPANVDGDDVQELLLADTTDSKWKYLPQAHSQRDLAASVTDGLGNTFSPTYVTMNSGTHDANGTPVAPTTRHARTGPFIVASYDSNDGIGGTYTKTYTYRGGLRNMHGRGFLGFKQVETVDSRDSLKRIVEYNQAFPLTGFPSLSRVQPVGTTSDLVLTQNSWVDYTGEATAATEPGILHFVHPSQVITTQWDPANYAAYVSQSTRVLHSVQYPYDYVHGQPTQIAEVVTSQVAPWTGKQWSTTTDLTYDSVGLSKHCLGLPANVTVTSSSDTSSAESRIRNTTYNSDCQPLTLVEGGATASTTERRKTTFEYQASGGLLQAVTVDSEDDVSTADRRTEIGWDASGYRQTTQTAVIAGQDNPVKSTTWLAELGLPATSTDPRGEATTNSYDGFGRLLTQTVDGAPDTTVTYSLCGTCFAPQAVYKVRTDLSTGYWEEAQFDRYGRVVGREKILVNGSTSRQTLAYNARGQLASEDTPYIGAVAATTTYEYQDILGRRTKVTAPTPDGGTGDTLFGYSPLTLAITDARLNTTVRQVDPLGRLRSVDPPDPAGQDPVGATEYTYSSFGQLASLSAPGAPATILKSWTYDGLGNPDVYVDANSGTWNFDYNVFGELVQRQDDMPTPNVTTWQYDQLGRVRQRDEPTLGLLYGGTTATTTWEYYTLSTDNGFGLPKKVTTPTDTYSNYYEQYTYDGFGRLSQTLHYNQGSFPVDYAYDSDGQLIKVTQPQSVNLVRYDFLYSYSYGYLDRVQWDDQTTITDIYDVGTSDPLGRPAVVRWGPFASASNLTINSYDSRTLALTAIQTSSGVSYDVQDYAYVWDKVGNLTSRTDNNQAGLTESFTYDALNRLTQVDLSTSGVPTMELSYYANGNIKTKTGVTAGAGVYQYGQNGAGPHAVTQITQAASDYNYYTDFHYDANGNLDCRGGTTSACDGAGQDKLTWYAFNKPQAIRFGGVTASFVYGPDRARIKQRRTDGASTVDIRYIGAGFEIETDGSLTTRYRHWIFANGRRIYWINEYYTASCTPVSGIDGYFLMADHLGSVDAIIHDVGSASSMEYSYDAFGLRREVTGWADDADYSELDTNQVINRGYTGHEHLDRVRAIHMNGRVYDPIIGRMLSVDPIIGEAARQTFNGYSYVGNNPLRYADPSGFSVRNIKCEEACGDNPMPTITVTAPRLGMTFQMTPAQALGMLQLYARTLLAIGRQIPDTRPGSRIRNKEKEKLEEEIEEVEEAIDDLEQLVQGDQSQGENSDFHPTNFVGRVSSVAIGVDAIFLDKGFTAGIGFAKFDLDGNPATVERKSFFFYRSTEVFGADIGGQIEWSISGNPNSLYGTSVEVGGSTKFLDFSIANPQPNNFWTSPLDHVHTAGGGLGLGVHKATIVTTPIFEWSP